MRTFLAIASFVFIVVAGLFLLTSLFSATVSTSDEDYNLIDFPDVLHVEAVSPSRSGVSRIMVVTQEKRSIVMNDFSQIAGVIDSGDGIYRYDEPQSSSYTIFYNEKNASFTIWINPSSDDWIQVRKQVSEQLVAMLNITEQESCLLSVYLGLVYSTRDTFSEDIGLSFCSN